MAGVRREQLADTMPLRDAVSDEPRKTVSRAWFEWFLSVATLLKNVPETLLILNRTLLQASVAATNLSVGAQFGGLYRVSWNVRITRPATTSSSLEVSLRWVHGGVTLTKTWPAIIGNTTDTTDGDDRLISVDVGQPIQYFTTYSSVGATPMQHSLDLVVERVQLS